MGKQPDNRDLAQFDLGVLDEIIDDLTGIQAIIEGSVLASRASEGEKVGEGSVEQGRELATRMTAMEQKSSRLGILEMVAAGRLAELEWRAVEAEVLLARLRGRRGVRLLNVFSGWVRRPWRLGVLLKGLAGVWVRVPLAELPAVKPGPDSYLSGLVTPPRSPRRRRFVYPHLRVAHAGGVAMFEKVAPHHRLGAVNLDEGLETGYDMLLVEPGVDDSLDDLPLSTLSRFTEASVPVVLVARTLAHLDLAATPKVDLVLTEDPDIGEQAASRQLPVLVIHPSVDDTVHNPIGFQRQPARSLLVIADSEDAGVSDIETLAPLTDRISLYGEAISGIDAEPARRPVGADQANTAREHAAAYTSPHLAATPTAYTQLTLDLTATGIPVIAASDPTLDTLLGGHYLPAKNTTEIVGHLETLGHPPTRERQSIPARRHVLTNHTRRHRFEQLLTQLNIPTNPTPRISILLSTNRPNNIEHALANVTNQNWPNKELILILHDPDQFDTTHIEKLTQNLPYPTTTIGAPKQWTLGDCLNAGLDQATGDYITKIDDDDHYGPNHLTDIHTAHTYSNADITGKTRAHTYLSEHDITVSQPATPETYGNRVAGGTITMDRPTAERYKFLRRPSQVDSTLFTRALEDGALVFSTHSMGYILSRNPGDHTWEMTGYEHFVKNADETTDGVSRAVIEVG